MNHKEIDLFERALEDINVSLSKMQQLTVADYHVALEAFRSVDLKQQGNGDNSVMNQTYRDLQCQDMFSQHTAHLIDLHKSLQNESIIPPGEINTIPTHNIVRLNRLQFEVAWSLWDGALKRIRQFVIKHASSSMKQSIDPASEVNLLLVKTAHNVQSRFGMLGELCSTWKHLELQPRIEDIRSAYSLTTERVVLDAYLKNITVCPETIRIELGDDEQTDLSIELF